MTKYTYKVVPAPTKGRRGRWARGAARRFADRLEQIFNEMAEEGWEYVRTDTLPAEERVGLTQKVTTFRNLLVFRMAKETEAPVLQVADLSAQPLALLPSPALAPSYRSNPGMDALIDDDYEPPYIDVEPDILPDVADATNSEETDDGKVVRHPVALEPKDSNVIVNPALMARAKQVNR